MTSERLCNTDLVSGERYDLKNRFTVDGFADEFDGRHDNRRIKLQWGDGDDDIKFKHRLCRDLCENHIVHCLFSESF